jgi:carbon monoxide dehydrogenase subunit G
MTFEKVVTVPANVDEAWSLLMDIPRVGMCLPGVVSVDSSGEGVYTGVMNVRVGVIKVSFQGRIEIVEQDPAARVATMNVQGDDKRVRSAVNATMKMRLVPVGDDSVELHLMSETAVFGRLGELGQAVMLKKADQIMTEFASNLARELHRAEETSGSTTSTVVSVGLQSRRRSFVAKLRRLLRLDVTTDGGS